MGWAEGRGHSVRMEYIGNGHWDIFTEGMVG